MLRAIAVLVLSAAAGLGFAQPNPGFNVKDYGAAGNGVRLDTESINKAVQACAAAGGGTVFFPAGKYLTGTVSLKDNVTLWLDSGATILGSTNLADYQWPKGERDWYASLILAQGVHNVGIAGHGIINGNGLFNPKGEGEMRGPHAALFYDCQDVSVRDVSFQDAGNYALILRQCERVNIDGMTAKGGYDGINMHYTKNVTISNCRLYTGDDCLAGAYWENVTVTNCILNTSCNGIRVGGRNVSVSNCLIYGPGQYVHHGSNRHNLESGFQILPHPAPGPRNPISKVVAPGPVDDMVISDVTMINARSPVWVAYSEDAPYSRSNLGVGRIIFNNLTVIGSGRTPFYVSAPPQNPAKSIIVNNAHLTFVGGAEESQATGQGFSPYSILQSYGVYCRNVEHLELHNVHVDYQAKDLRPALSGENIGTLEVDRFRAEREPEGPPEFVISGLKRMLVDGKEAPAANFRVKGLDIDTSRIITGEPFQVTVRVENAGSVEGLGEVPLRLGEQKFVKSVWLKPGETARVRFVNLKSAASGQQPLQSGDFTKELRVLPKPAAHPVNPPYHEFHNTTATLQQIDGGFYIWAGGRYPLLELGDEYAAIYREHALARDDVAVVKLENPDMRTHWSGRAGIMVRNDISQPGKSPGYVVLGCSPANGPSLEWDSNGDGRIDKYTVLDGYTNWPNWLKLERHGSTYIGYYSSDGTNWTKVGEVEAPGSADLQDVGIFAQTSSARFTDLKLGDSGF